MAISSLQPLSRRFAYTAGNSLVRWATRPRPQFRNRRPVDHGAAMRRIRAQRQIEWEREQSLSRLFLLPRQF